MFVVLFAFGDEVLVCVQYNVCKYSVGLVRVLGWFDISECVFYFECELLP